MKIKFIVALSILAAIMTSCATNNPHNGLYCDVIGFSNKVDGNYFKSEKHRGRFKNLFKQEHPYDLTNESDNGDFKNKSREIPNRVRGDNTSLYYAVETACDRIRYVRKREMKRNEQTKYYLFLLTDGLDNWSSQAAKEDGQTLLRVKQDKYPKRIRRKIKRTMGFGKNLFEVHPSIMVGADLKSDKPKGMSDDEYIETEIKPEMECFRYSSREEAPEAINATNFDIILKELKHRFLTSSYSFKVPKAYLGKKIKMTFINENKEEATLEGLFKKKFLKYVLCDVKLDGIEISKHSIYAKDEGKTLIAPVTNLKDNKGGDVLFKIEEIERNKDRYDVDSASQQFEYKPNMWRTNSEYREVAQNYINIYSIFVIDASKSLDGKDHNLDGFEQEMKIVDELSDILCGKSKK